jgi:hypothetical protein
MKKNEVIQLVNESTGSLFTKEDVINLINKVEGESSVDLNELRERVISIVEDADVSDIEISKYHTTFRITNGNEIEVDDADFDASHYVNAITHDIGELFSNIETNQEEEVEQ